LTYGSFATEGLETTQASSFYHKTPNEAHQYVGIIWLLQQFSWTWVGLLVADDDNGEHFLKILEPLLSWNGICPAFITRITQQSHMNKLDGAFDVLARIHEVFTYREASIFILYGDTLTVAWLRTTIFLGDIKSRENPSFGKVWILTTQIDLLSTGLHRNWDFQLFQGAISLAIHSKELPGFKEFVQKVKPSWNHKENSLKDFWEQAFDCFFPDPTVIVDDLCTGEENLESLPTGVFEMHVSGHSYSIYNAVYALAHALHASFLSKARHHAMVRGGNVDLQFLQPWQLHRSLQGLSFNNSVHEMVSFNDKVITGGGFDIMNIITFPNKSFQRVKIGKLDPSDHEGKEFILHQAIIVWHDTFNQVTPVSVCNGCCPLGTQKKRKEEYQFCCYACDPCPEGKISNQSDMKECFPCPEDQYPNEEKNGCENKIIHFLSYDDHLGTGLASIAFTFSLTTALVLGTFIKHNNTPIVRANNQELTFILLISLLLCFLSSLLFLGQPGTVTCLLRQPTFGIIFSVAVSCVLAKTTIVSLAFRATKPGSRMKTWVGKGLAYCIVLPCSLIQASICIVWLATSPPFPDLDKHSVTEEIIVQCDEGSAIMFYCVLSYMALLAISSFVVAFQARKLPDTFNEAKCITFSMLVFCAVWISFVPAYFSTKGKNMVAVEIFSILFSSAGVLCCIFFPKCYIILLKPELNTREQLSIRKH
ncbi:vomeronasal type-2 receptor 26-like, partial [Varanus komodoensis]|uniref:vomeronasal type-2 receptor 26-like n=1 Tax=Varanus komodoensis TaxID=61221 RepID=UPI001CF7D550